jgi:GxxExxY protein
MLHEDITRRIIDAAMRVHTALGAGLLESTYATCLLHELELTGLHLEHQVRLPVVYRGQSLEAGYRIDFLIETASSSRSKQLKSC